MGKFLTRYLRKEEFDRWNSFVENEEDGNIFHHGEWIQSIFRFQDQRIETRILVCIDKDDNICGGLAFGSLKKYGVRLIVHPYLTQFSGLLLSHRQTKYFFKDLKYRNEMLKSLIGILEKDYDVIDLSFSPSLMDIRMFTWKQYKSRVKYTFVGNLENEEKIFRNLNPATRRQIKKAEKQNVIIDKGVNEKLIRDFYHLQSLSLNRQQHEIKFKLKDFISLILTLKKVPFNLSFYVAYKFDTPIAAQANIAFKKTAYYWLAGGDPSYFKTGVNQLLMYNVFQDLLSNRIKYFDFVGANTPGVSDYKANYNFNLTPYYGVKKTLGFYPKILMKLKETLF